MFLLLKTILFKKTNNELDLLGVEICKYVLSQYNQLKKIEIDTIVDIKTDQAKSNCSKSGLSQDTIKK